MKRTAALITLLSLFLAAPSVAFAAEPVGSVTFVSGKVDITRPGQAAVALLKGQDVYVADVIRTKSRSKAEITFVDDSLVRVAQKSRIEITEYMFERQERQSTLSLFRGKIQSLVKKVAGFSFGQGRKNRFEVRTPTAVCGVRGTDFFTWFVNGETGTAFKEGEGYIYPANNPGLAQNVNTGEAGYVADPDAAPVVKPATDADLEQHLEDTIPTEGEDEGEGGDDGGDDGGGSDLTLGTEPSGGGDDGGTGTGSGTGLTNDDKTILDLRDSTEITGVTLFSGDAAIGFLSAGTISGEVDDLAGSGPVTLAGALAGGVGPGDTAGGTIGGTMALPDDTETGAFDGQITGVGGSWNGLFVSFYAQEPETPAPGIYDVGFLYGALSSGADYSSASAGDPFSAAGTAYRSLPLGQAALTIPAEGTLLDALAGQIGGSAIPLPVIDGTLTAGRPVSGATAGSLATLATTGTRMLGIGTHEATGTYSNPDLLGGWTSIYGYSGGGYLLGSVSGSDDLAGHIAYGGNLTYMDAGYLGNVNIWSRGAEGEGLGIVTASAVTLDPLAYSGTWAGTSVYENNAGAFNPFATDSGIIGGRTPGELIAYGSFSTGPNFEPGKKYLFNTDVDFSSAAIDATGVAAGLWKMQDAPAYGPNQINYGLISGEAVALLRNPTTDEIGLVASKNIAGRFYPNVYMPVTDELYPNIEMFNLVGSWVYSPAEDGTLYPDTNAQVPMTEASLVGDFNGTGSIAGGLGDGYTSYFYDGGGYGGGPGWGIYNIKLGAGSAENVAYRETSDTAWSAKLGGLADFGTGTSGYFLADVNGTWTLEEHAQISGTVSGMYLSEKHVGQLGGPFYGANAMEAAPIDWIGESIGIYEGDWVDFAGEWGAEYSLYYNDLGHMTYAGDDPGIFGVKKYADGHTEFLAMGTYSDGRYGDRYLWNSRIDGQQLLEDDTGAYAFDSTTVFDGFTAGLWLRDPEEGANGALSGDGWFVVNDKAGNGRIMRADLTGDFYDMPLSLQDGMWYAKSNAVQTLLPDVEEQYKTGIAGATLQTGSVGVGAMGGAFSGDGYSGFGGEIMPGSQVLYLNHGAKGDLPWGVFDLRLSGSNNFSRRPAGSAAWSGVIAGGEADFDGSSLGRGMFVASAAGTWNDDGEIFGKVGIESTAAGAFGKYMSPYQVGGFSDTGGGIGGDFSGINTSEGSWIGQSVGMFSGSLLSLSGSFNGEHPEIGSGGYGGYLGFSDMGSFIDGLVGTTADPGVGTTASYYVMGHNPVNTPITSVAAGLHEDGSGNQYFTLLDFYSGSADLTGYGVGLYANAADQIGFASYTGLSGTHYGKVPVFDAEGQIALEAPIPGYTYSGLTSFTIDSDSVSDSFLLDVGSITFSGGLRGENYALAPGAPGVHRTIGFGSDIGMYWTMSAIGRSTQPEGVFYEGPGSHGELYYIAVDEELDTGVVGRLGGELSGDPYGVLTLSGTPTETPLEGWLYWGQPSGGEGSLHHYGSTEVGYDYGILGGYSSGGQLRVLSMGGFEIDPAYSLTTDSDLLWATSLTESPSSGIQGYTGGIWSGGAMDGEAFMVVDRTDEGLGYGIVLADILGNYFEMDDAGIYYTGGWLAAGQTDYIRMANTVASETLTDDPSDFLVGGGDSYPYSGSALILTYGEVSGTNFEDEPWGVWGSYLHGTQGGAADFSSWFLSLQDDGITDPAERMWVEASGGSMTDQETIEGRAAGAWASLEDATTGIFGGPVKGTFDPAASVWQAVAGGAFLEAGKFLWMVENDPGALDQLQIPRFEVGRTDLVGSNGNMSVNIDDMIFFAHSTGARPSIWATEKVGGSYGSLPGSGDNVSLSGTGFTAVNFTVDNFTETVPGSDTGAWGALIDGSGTVPGTSHSVQIEGGAAGAFGGGGFSGTGAGVAK